MGRVVFVEVLGRRGQVTERVRLERFPAYVGRAYSNDVILGDRFVSPRHAAVRETESGELVVEDLDSTNGLEVVGGPAREPRVALRPALELRLGETTLRFACPEDAVAPAERLRPHSGWLRAARNPFVALAVGCAAVAAFALDLYLEAYYDYTWADLLGPALGGLFLMALWSGVWAFASRLLTHRFDFLGHLAVVATAAVVLIVVQPVVDHAEFLTSSHTLALTLLTLAQGVVLALMIYGHLSLLSVSTARGRGVWSAGTTILLMGLGGLLAYAGSEDFSTEVEVTTPIRSLGSGVAPTVSLDEFLGSVDEAREWVDERREGGD